MVLTQFNVQVPPGVVQGMAFQFYAGPTLMQTVCPPGVGPGQMIMIQLVDVPAPQTQQPTYALNNRVGPRPQPFIMFR